MPYIFVFSYARDDQDPYLVKFYEDLNHAVARRAGLPKGARAGFFDQTEIRLGEHWPSELANALASAPALVMLYPPIYFSKFYCGKEVQVFLDRQREARGGTALLPILWLPVRGVPPAVDYLQRQHASLGELYAEKGLQHLRTLKRYADAYKTVVLEVAERIVQCLDKPLPPMNPMPAILATRNAFDAPVTPSGPESAVSGPASVSFIYVTGRSRDARAWAPYPPPENQIWKVSFDVARAQEMVPQFMPLDGRLVERLRAAAVQNEVVVLLVDGMALDVEPYCTRMREYDVCNYVNCAALVIWPNDFRAAQRSSVDDLLKRGFPNSKSRQQIWFHNAINSLDELRAALSATLRKLQVEIISRAEDRGAPESRELPIIG